MRQHTAAIPEPGWAAPAPCPWSWARGTWCRKGRWQQRREEGLGQEGSTSSWAAGYELKCFQCRQPALGWRCSDDSPVPAGAEGSFHPFRNRVRSSSCAWLTRGVITQWIITTFDGLAFLCVHAVQPVFVQTLHVLFSPCKYLHAPPSVSSSVLSAVQISDCGADVPGVRTVLLSPHHHPIWQRALGTVLTQYLLQYSRGFSFDLVVGRGRMGTCSLQIHAPLLQPCWKDERRVAFSLSPPLNDMRKLNRINFYIFVTKLPLCPILLCVSVVAGIPNWNQHIARSHFMLSGATLAKSIPR